MIDVLGYNTYHHGNFALVIALTAEAFIHESDSEEDKRVAEAVKELCKAEEKEMNSQALDILGI